jgi:hypothetical protein
VRGADDLKVTYLVFPGTAKKPFGPPNLDEWHEKVSGYLKDIGGLGDGYTLYKWEEMFPKPAPAKPATDAVAGQGGNAQPSASPPNAGPVPPTTPEPAPSATLPAPTPASPAPGETVAKPLPATSAKSKKR